MFVFLFCFCCFHLSDAAQINICRKEVRLMTFLLSLSAFDPGRHSWESCDFRTASCKLFINRFCRVPPLRAPVLEQRDRYRSLADSFSLQPAKNEPARPLLRDGSHSSFQYIDA